jgi:hypothetical protein
MTSTIVLAALAASQAGAPPAIRFEERRVERKLPGCDNKESGCAHAKFEWVEAAAGPAAARAKINSAVMEWLLRRPSNDPAASPSALAEGIIDMYDRSSHWREHLYKKVRPLRITPPVVSLECSESFFFGGAHGSFATTYLNFDPATGARVMLDGLLDPGSLGRLTAIAEAHFRQERKLSATADLKQEGFTFEEGRFQLSEVYGFSASALIFVYNIYDIAPYSMGPTEVRIPYAEIRDLLKGAW